VIGTQGALDPGPTFGAIFLLRPGSDAVTLFVGGSADLDVEGAPVADATTLYFEARTNGTHSVYAMARAGGAPYIIIPNVDFTPLAVDGTRLYGEICQRDQSGPGITCELATTPLTGGNPTVLMKLGTDVASDLAVDDRYAYWTIDGPDGRLVRYALDGSDGPTTLADQLPWARDLVVDNATIYWLNYGDRGVDCTPSDGSLLALAPGGTAQTLAHDIAAPGGLLVDGSNAYYYANLAECNGGPSTDGNTIERIPITGGDRVVLIDSVQATGLAIDKDNLYWSFITDNTKQLGAVAEMPR
jgi:hypothetical protein